MVYRGSYRIVLLGDSDVSLGLFIYVVFCSRNSYDIKALFVFK